MLKEHILICKLVDTTSPNLNMANKDYNDSESQASILHSLLVDAMEGSLRQQLMSGDYSPQMLGRVLDFLKHNNITVTSSADKRMAFLADIIGQIDMDDL